MPNTAFVASHALSLLTLPRTSGEASQGGSVSFPWKLNLKNLIHVNPPIMMLQVWFLIMLSIKSGVSVMFFRVSNFQAFVCVSTVIVAHCFLQSHGFLGILPTQQVCSHTVALQTLVLLPGSSALRCPCSLLLSPPKSLLLREAFPTSLHERICTTPNHSALFSFQHFFICY